MPGTLLSAARCRDPRPAAVLLALAVGWACVQRPTIAPPAPHDLARIWDAIHVSGEWPALVTHADVVRRLQDLQRLSPDLFSVEEIGTSVEGRSIHHLWFGRGPMRVLLWSQMHGDEPTATSALLDVYEYFRLRADEPVARRILEALTIQTVPMLNPDGAQRFVRRNAQGIDINRDALRLQTPEGRALKALRDRLDPPIGFNLHDQNWQTSVGTPPQPASISLLSVAYDEARSQNAGRVLTKKLASVIRDAIEPFAQGRIGRYDDSFEVRAFGDNLTKWGTSVLLIETGPGPGETPGPPLVRLNFVAILTALDALATGRVHRADAGRYESLPLNDSMLFATLIRGATVIPGTGVPAFTADVGLVSTRGVQERDGRREVVVSTRVEDVGDLRVFGALETIDAAGLLLAPTVPGAQRGAVIAPPEPADPRWKETTKVRMGEPADLMLIRPEGDGRARVERVFEARRVVAASPAGALTSAKQ